VGFVVAFVFLCILSGLKFYPFGGVRHSLMLAPFLYLSFGYGLLWVGSLVGRVRLPAVAFGVYVLLLFAVAGRNIYPWRQARLDVNEVAAFAEANDVQTIVGMAYAYDALYALDENDALAGFDVRRLTPGEAPPTDGPYLLVNYRYTLEDSAPVFEEGGDFRVRREALGTVTPLVEEIGPLPQFTGPAGVSIYAPPNGMFVYVVEPS
jgi:hypothetical protein